MRRLVTVASLYGLDDSKRSLNVGMPGGTFAGDHRHGAQTAAVEADGGVSDTARCVEASSLWGQ